jgi:hypothetical protein
MMINSACLSALACPRGKRKIRMKARARREEICPPGGGTRELAVEARAGAVRIAPFFLMYVVSQVAAMTVERALASIFIFKLVM